MRILPILATMLAAVVTAVARAQPAATQPETPPPTLAVPLLSHEPAIDGTIRPQEWADAAIADGFFDFQTGQPARKRTLVHVARSADALLLAFECFEPEPARLIARVKERNGGAWGDDSIEVFLAPFANRDRFTHFVVSASGAQYDSGLEGVGAGLVWQAAVARTPRSWTAEVRIPYATLGLWKGSPGAPTWLGNFCRNDRVPASSGGTGGTGGTGGAGGPGGGDQTAAWSRTYGSFHNPTRFGVLTAFPAAWSDRPINPRLQARSVEVGETDMPQVDVTLRTNDAGPPGVQLQFVSPVSGQPLGDPHPWPITGHKVSIMLPAPATAAPVPGGLQLIATDQTDHRLLAFSLPFTLEPPRPLVVDLVYPRYRAIVQSRDPDKTFRANVRWANDTARGVHQSLRVQIFAAAPGPPGAPSSPGAPGSPGPSTAPSATAPAQRGPVVWADQRWADGAGSVTLTHDLSRLPVGSYVARFDLLDPAGKVLVTEPHPFDVLAPAPTEVSFDDRGRMIVNGKKVFPIGLYHVNRSAVVGANAFNAQQHLPPIDFNQVLHEVKARGFNMVSWFWMTPGTQPPDEDYLARTQKEGLMIVCEGGNRPSDDFARVVAAANRYTNIIAWYGMDEAAGSPRDRQAALDEYPRYRKIDPHRPLVAANNIQTLEADLLNLRTNDILSMDIYPIRALPMVNVARYLDTGLQATHGRTPLWLVPQAFYITGHWEEPTEAELRCQAYLGIVHGATGLFWYALETMEPSKGPKGRPWWYLPDSPLWDWFPALNSQIHTLEPVLLDGTPLGPACCDNENIHSATWEYEGHLYLIAVNPFSKPAQCTFSGLGAKGAQVMFESRQLEGEGDLHDTFAPLACHVYRLALPR